MKTQIYMAEVGVCLQPDNDEYELYKCIDGLDYSLYDENMAYFTDKEKAIQFVSDYIKDGVANTYGMVVDCGLWNLDCEALKELEEQGYAEDFWEKPKKEDIVWFRLKGVTVGQLKPICSNYDKWYTGDWGTTYHCTNKNKEVNEMEVTQLIKEKYQEQRGEWSYEQIKQLANLETNTKAYKIMTKRNNEILEVAFDEEYEADLKALLKVKNVPELFYTKDEEAERQAIYLDFKERHEALDAEEKELMARYSIAETYEQKTELLKEYGIIK